MTAKTATGLKEALAVTGALMLVENRLWQELGGMDENFFIALEDVDFSLRAWEKGRRVIYQGASVAVHHEGLTRGNTPANKDPFWFAQELRGLEYFFGKWGRKLSCWNDSIRRIEGPSRRGQSHPGAGYDLAEFGRKRAGVKGGCQVKVLFINSNSWVSYRYALTSIRP